MKIAGRNPRYFYLKKRLTIGHQYDMVKEIKEKS
nr:MAG TPA: hypothetical protein [Caudoviricetes sp.]